MDQTTGPACAGCGEVIPMTEVLFTTDHTVAIYRCPKCGEEGCRIGFVGLILALTGRHGHIGNEDFLMVAKLQEADWQPHAAMAASWPAEVWEVAE